MMIYLCSPAIEQHLKANGFQKTIYLELTARRTFSPNARKQKNPPANPISGSELPVLGNCDERELDPMEQEHPLEQRQPFPMSCRLFPCEGR